MTSRTVTVSEPTHVAEARRVGARVAALAGFDETETGKLALIATEAATNLLKYGGGGEILFRPLECEPSGAEILALDKGPGMPDVALSMHDGHSTSGTPGTGLGAIRRLAGEFDVYSRAGHGTVVLARLRSRSTPPKSHGYVLPKTWGIGAVSVVMPGEEVCGDAWSVKHNGSGCTLMLADGLGHGVAAATAARCAEAVFAEHSALDPADLLEAIHGELRPTRGAAISVARIDSGARRIRFAGVGNVSGVILGHEIHRQMVSHPGIAGHNAAKIREFSYDWPPGTVVVLHSDGISGHWHMERYPGLTAHDAAVIAGVLYRDFRRQRDDATVVVVREERQ